jgi:hypothetical protein
LKKEKKKTTTSKQTKSVPNEIVIVKLQRGRKVLRVSPNLRPVEYLIDPSHKTECELLNNNKRAHNKRTKEENKENRRRNKEKRT